VRSTLDANERVADGPELRHVHTMASRKPRRHWPFGWVQAPNCPAIKADLR
jgi:hypothetical protein